MNVLAIPHEFVDVGGTTRNNYKIQTRRPPGLTEINTEGPRVSHDALRRLARQLLERRHAPKAMAFCGSLPPGAASTTYQRWIVMLRRRQILTVLDTSGAALRDGVAARPWLIKPNRDEAQELLGRRLTSRAPLIRAAQALLKLGPEHVILSLGREGALLASRDDVWRATPPSVKVDSPVGAGDSLVGGFLVGWMKGRSLPEAFRLGVACGTATAMTPGTELCHLADVRTMLPHVQLKRVG
jgi:1-phosphofructokinase family hexose kinase